MGDEDGSTATGRVPAVMVAALAVDTGMTAAAGIVTEVTTVSRVAADCGCREAVAEPESIARVHTETLESGSSLWYITAKGRNNCLIVWR